MVNTEFLGKVKVRMQEMIRRDIPINKRTVDTDDAVALFLSLIHILQGRGSAYFFARGHAISDICLNDRNGGVDMPEYRNATASLKENTAYVNEILPVQESFDIVQRNMMIGGREAAFFFVDGFTKDESMLKIMDSMMSITEEDMPDVYKRQV